MSKLTAKLERQAQVEQLGDPHKKLLLLDPKNVVILYNKLCDDVYVIDWL